MTHRVFEHDLFLTVPTLIVKDYLSTLSNQARLHPLIIDAQELYTTVTADGNSIQHYRIRDRIHQWLFTYHVTYFVTMNVNSGGDITTDAYRFPGVILHNTTTCRTEAQGTRITEHIEITAPRLLMYIIYAQARKAHCALFDNLKQLLEKMYPSTQGNDTTRNREEEQ
ncbi:MAG TPA: SRPBCC family protein [Dictyobacter sp.]|nr:SRPBCC family protein [Dictyobacter sp.]